jgi:hypothetical protein
MKAKWYCKCQVCQVAPTPWWVIFIIQYSTSLPLPLSYLHPASGIRKQGIPKQLPLPTTPTHKTLVQFCLRLWSWGKLNPGVRAIQTVLCMYWWWFWWAWIAKPFAYSRRMRHPFLILDTCYYVTTNCVVQTNIPTGGTGTENRGVREIDVSEWGR